MSAWRPTGCKAVLFDMDDTLYPEQAYVRSGFRAAARWLEAETGLPAVDTEPALIALFESGVRGDTFDRWLAQLGLPAEQWVPGLVAAYRAHRPDIEPFPGVRRLLAALQDRVALGLISDGYLAVQQAKFAALDLDRFFACVIFSDQWGRQAWKPSPRPFQEALRCLGVAPAAAVYVADNPTKDFLGARRLGLGAVRLQQAGGVYAHLEPPTPAHAPDVTVKDIAGLTRLLQPEAVP